MAIDTNKTPILNQPLDNQTYVQIIRGGSDGEFITPASSFQATLGFTPVPNTRTITINGSSQDLTANRTYNTFALVPVQSVTSAATVTPTDANQLVVITAQAEALTLAAPTGSPVQGQSLMIRIKDDGTARGITWTSGAGGYRAIGVTLPTTTVINKTTYVGCIYNSNDSRWDVVGVTTEA